MKYYILDREDNPKIAGKVFPQAWAHQQPAEKQRLTTTGDSLLLQNERHPSIPEFECLTLSYNAKITDIITTSVVHRPAISRKAAEIFAGCNLGRHEMYKCPLYTQTGALEYYCIYPMNSMVEFVNFYNTFFRANIHEPECYTLKMAGIGSYNGYKSLSEIISEPVTLGKYLALKKGFDKELDYFAIPEIQVFYGIVSERLKSKLEEAGITGVKFSPLEVLVEPDFIA